MLRDERPEIRLEHDGCGSDAGARRRVSEHPRTVVVASKTAADAARVALARDGVNGVRVLTVAALASRLAGNFLSAVPWDELLEATHAAVSRAPREKLGDLAGLADAPGMPRALARTLSGAWRADLALDAGAGERLATVARLEEAVVRVLPASRRRPRDLAALALERLPGSAALGPVEFRSIGDLAPCWRRLVVGLSEVADVTWACGPRAVPEWLQASRASVATSPALDPVVTVESCATPRHEALEAMRWARRLLASGVPAGEIAIAAADTGPYDDLITACAEEAGICVHFARGRRAVGSAPGQAAAALAELLERGPDVSGLRRLRALSRADGSPLRALPSGWASHVPCGLRSGDALRASLEAAGAPAEVSAPLLAALEVVASGDAAAAGELLLSGAARDLWRRALRRGPAARLGAEVAEARLPDPNQAPVSVAWMGAAILASCPRRHVRLLGLDARSWPRRRREDPILPDHVLDGRRLDWRDPAEADRADFATIVATTSGTVECSYPRRDAGGREVMASDLLAGRPSARLLAGRAPTTVVSESERLAARPAEFAASPHGVKAACCWRDWQSPVATPHDGLVRADHPAIARALRRPQSPASLTLMLRNPLGFLWRYVLGWRAPEEDADDVLDLDAAAFGSLVHQVLDAATKDLEAGPTLFAADDAAIRDAVRRAATGATSTWQSSRVAPPRATWSARVAKAEALAANALLFGPPPLPGGTARSEARFGARPSGDGAAVVALDGTPFVLAGRIDRLDVSADGRAARVVDYKTGATIRADAVLDGGREIQRCLYARAATALLPSVETVEAALLYPRAGGDGYRPLADPAETWMVLRAALDAAHGGLLGGRALPGPDAGERFDDMAIAMPAPCGSMLAAKKDAARPLLGEASRIWSEP